MTSLPLGQLFVFGFDGHSLSLDAKDLLKKEKLSGAILFSRNVHSLEQVVDLNCQILDASPKNYPALISVDQEGGRVARLKDICTPVPSMRRLGDLAKNIPDLPYRTGAMMAREMVSMGFHLDFAPVVDVDTNPQNPIIGDRSFSSDPQQVAALSAAFIKGMQAGGLAACAKHFPGHGDTHVDSHLDLPVLEHDLKRVNAIELLPFQSSIEAGVASIMTAHILFKSLDSKHPATLSPFILKGLLRQQLGFEGVIFSDDLEMKAVADRYSIKELVKLGLLAGVDLFLICKDMGKIHEAIRAVHQLVDSGEVPMSYVEEALKRVENLKNRFIGAVALPSLNNAKQMVGCSPHVLLAKNWA